MKRLRKHVPYTVSRLTRIAYLAGAGCSASEIASEMGMKVGTLYWLLSENRIPLAQRTGADSALTLIIAKRSLADAETLSRELAMPPTWMMARLLEVVLSERTVAVNLLDGVRAPE